MKKTHRFFISIRKTQNFLFAFLCMAILLPACIDSDESNSLQEEPVPFLDLSGMELEFSFQDLLSRPVVLKREDVDIEELTASLIEFMVMSVGDIEELGPVRKSGSAEAELIPYVGYDITVDDEYISIIIIQGEEPLDPSSDDKACGGQAGDGWTLYKTCYSDECAEKEAKKVGEILKASLESGQCMDIRVKRNAMNAKVCGRVVNC